MHVQIAAKALCQVPWERVSVEFDGLDANTPTHRLRGRCFDGALVATLLGDAQGKITRKLFRTDVVKFPF